MDRTTNNGCRFTGRIAVCALLLLTGQWLFANAPFLEKTDLFEEGKDGFTLYRIPGIVVTAKGTALAYCEARKNSVADRGEIEIHMRRSTDGGRTWSPAKQVAHLGPRLPQNPNIPDEKDKAKPGEQTVNNPVAIAARDGTVHLIYCVEYMRCFHIHSVDDGITWSKPTEITSAFESFRKDCGIDWYFIATGPGHAVELESGRLCAPFWFAAKNNRGGVATIYSDDGGKTWKHGDLVMHKAGEPNIARLSDGRVIVTVRNSSSRRLASTSADGATGWSSPFSIEELLEPGCMAGITAYQGIANAPAHLLLFSNLHTTKREHFARRDLTIHLSGDDGKTWPVQKTLQAGPSAYSDLAVLPDGTILCFYENGAGKPVVKRKRDWAYTHLTVARFNLEWLTDDRK